MKRSLYTASVESVNGWQTFYIDAETREEADERAREHDTNGIYQEELSVEDIGRLVFDNETDLDDFGDFPPTAATPIPLADAAAIAEREAFKLLAALVDIYDDGQNNAPEDRCYVEGAWKETLDEARAYIAARAALATTEATDAIASILPERDPAKSAEQQGLFRKFDVRRVDGSDRSGGKHDGCEYFVLDVTHDQHAATALRAYANACAETHPQLSTDLVKRYGTAPSPEAPAVDALADEQWEDLQEAREILENMVRSIELDGNYSTEATCTFLRQALQCLPVAVPAVDAPSLQQISDYLNGLDTIERQLVERAAHALHVSVAKPAVDAQPVPMALNCPSCEAKHIDEGEWATRPHKTHQCQWCGHAWRPFEYCTVGVPAVDALTTGAVAEVESWTNGSYHRNYKLRWLRDVEKGTKLYTHPASEPKALTLTDARIEECIDASGGFWMDDEFRINGKDLMNLCRALLADRGSEDQS